MARSTHLEMERKYDAGASAAVPDLSGIPGLSGVRDEGTVELEALYWDAAGQVLLGQGITVRRRSGGKDEGWHLKFPADRGRLEVHFPLQEPWDAVPAEVLDLVQVHLRGRALEPVARLRTLRKTTTLTGADGASLVEFCDDTVDARDLGAGTESTWREWEVELSDSAQAPQRDQSAWLDAIEARLRAAGATPAPHTAKLHRALDSKAGPVQQKIPTAPKGSVRAVLTPAFRGIAEELKAWDPLVRLDQKGSIHQLRIRARTLRSMLKTYRRLLDKDQAEDLQGRLQKVGRTLSAARDAQVMGEHTTGRIGGRPAGTVPKKITKRLEHTAAASYRKARQRLLEELNSREYFDTLDALDAFTARLPLRSGATDGGKAAKKLPAAAKREQKRVLESVRDAEREKDPNTRLELLHDVRKRSKRLRYAIQAVAAGRFDFGKKLDKSMKSSEKIQDALGAHRDSINFQEYLATTARAAHSAGQSTFVYGVLHEAETPVQEAAEAAYRKALKKIR